MTPKEDPYLPPALEDVTRSNRLSLTWIEVVVVAVIIVILTSLLLPAVRAAREAKLLRYNSNLKAIGLGILNYEHVFKCYPPAYLQDSQGKNLHSWRSLILPFVEQSNAFEAIDFSAPWNSSENVEARRLLDRVPCFQCPDSQHAQLGFSVYHASAGEDAFFHPSLGRLSKEIIDPGELTLMIVESHHRHSVPIMKPEDLSTSQLCTSGFPWAPRHDSDKFYVTMADCSLRAIPVSTDPLVFREMIRLTRTERSSQ